jgi:type I restriction enzyme, S subunit
MGEILKREGDRRDLDMGEGMSEWREYTLGDFAEIQTGPFGSQLHASDYVNEGIPSIMPTNIGGRLEIKTENIACIKDEDAKRLKKYLIKENDIVYSRRGDVEKCAFITEKESGWLCGTGCLRVRFVSNEISPKFCAYYLSTDEVKSWVSGNAVGTTMPNLNSSILQRLPLNIPPLSEQKAIASILSSLDDKIDLLHRQNRTLEAIAETLFRQWFIEEAQENWEEGTLANYAIHQKTNVKPASKPLQEFIHYSLPAFDAEMTPVKELGSEILSSKYAVEPWVILVSKLNPQVSRVWAIGERLGENSICSMEFQVFKPKSRSLFGFLYYFLKSSDAREELSMGASGTSGSHQRVRPEDILNLRIKTSSVELAECFSEQVMPGLNRIMRNLEQIRTLEKLRDNLLPKLMSGEVQVKLSTEE